MSITKISFEQFLQSNIETFGIVIFLLGLLLGNWLSIGRDRRREFNEIADEVNTILRKERERAVERLVSDGISFEQFQHLKRRVSCFSARGLNKAISAYNVARGPEFWELDSFGQPHYIEPEKIIVAIDALLGYVHRK